jgi:HPt (histidine-containing phosphotransfer) domain-containing protein/two-component sensor histidine kinase
MHFSSSGLPVERSTQRNQLPAPRESPLVQRLWLYGLGLHGALLPPNLSDCEPEFRSLVRSIVWSLLVVTAAMLLLATVNFALGLPRHKVCLVLMVPSMIGLLMFRAGYVRAAFHVVTLLIVVGLDVLILLSGGPSSSAAAWLVLLPIIALAILPPRSGLVWLSIAVANQVLLLWFFNAGLFNRSLTAPGLEVSEFAVPFIAASVVAALYAYKITQIRDDMTTRLAGVECDVRLVLDNVRTGFLVLGRDGRLNDRPTRGVTDWLPGADAGVCLVDLLALDNPDRALEFDVAVDALAEEMLPLELCLAQMPRSWDVNGVPHRLAFHLVYDDPGQPWTQLAITVHDAREELQRAAAEADRDALASIVQLLQSERDAFLDFVEESDRLVLSLESNARGDGWLRALHTLKGNAAVFGLARFSQVCHTAEQLALAGDREDALRRVSDAWHAWRVVFDVLADEGGFDGVRLDDASYSKFVHLLSTHESHEQLLHAARLWTYQRVRKALERVAARASSVAERLGKPAPLIVVDSPDLRVDRARWRPLWAAMIHLVRNAVDHGIESPADRRRAHKPAQGTLSVRSHLHDDILVIAVADDGAGIDWKKVRANAAALGLPTTHEESIDWLLADGVTTRKTVDQVSGRGIGLAALAEAVKELEGSLSVHSKLGRGTEWRIHIPMRCMHAADESRATKSAVLRALAA